MSMTVGSVEAEPETEEVEPPTLADLIRQQVVNSGLSAEDGSYQIGGGGD